MNKFFFVLAILTIRSSHSAAQEPQVNIMVMMQAVSGAIHVPLGNFSETHLGGVGFQYEWYGKKLGRKPANKQVLVFSANGGVAMYKGKKEKIVTTSYTYPVYIFMHVYGGLAWRPMNRFQLAATGGPAIGIYNGHTDFNLGASLDAQFFISNRISAGPAIRLMKEKGSDPLWAGSLGVHYFF